MTPEQLRSIPDGHLKSRDTGQLLTFLSERGWRMTLLELHQERARRHFKSNPTKRTGTWIPRAAKEKR